MDYFKISKFFLYLAPFTVVIVTTSTLFPFIVGKYVFFRTVVGLAFILFLLGLVFNQRSSAVYQRLSALLKSPLVIAVSVFTFIFLLAGFFGFDPHFSFWSNFERGEGGLQIIFLFLYFFLLSAVLGTKEEWRKFLWFAVIAAVMMIFYGIGAGLKYVDADLTTVVRNGAEEQVLSGTGGFFYQTFKEFIGPAFSDPGYRFAGSVGNPAYVATYLLFSIFFVLYLIFQGDRQKRLLTLAVFFFAAFFVLAATRGAFLGLVAAAAAGLIYAAYANRRFRKPVAASLVVLTLFLSAGFYFRDHPALKDVPTARIFKISLKEDVLQHRAIMWGIAVEGWKERPLLGWGPENYLHIFYRYYNPAYHVGGQPYGAWFDRAHSVYFDYLSQTGILGLLAYLSVFGAAFWLILKRKSASISQNQQLSAANNNQRLYILKALFLASIVAYLVQGLVLFEVLVIYIQLYTFLALLQWSYR